MKIPLELKLKIRRTTVNCILRYLQIYSDVQLLNLLLSKMIILRETVSHWKSFTTHFHIWAKRTRREKTFILWHLFFGQAKLVWAGNITYYNFVKGYLLKMDPVLSLRREKLQKNIFMYFFNRFFGRFSHQIGKHLNFGITYLDLYYSYDFCVAHYEREPGLICS